MNTCMIKVFFALVIMGIIRKQKKLERFWGTVFFFFFIHFLIVPLGELYHRDIRTCFIFFRRPLCHDHNKRKQKFCPWALFLVVRTNLIPEHKSSSPLPPYLQPRLDSHVTRAFRTTIADAYFRNKTEREWVPGSIL